MDDWLPFRFFTGELPTASQCTIAHLVPEAPEMVEIAVQVKHWLSECELRHPDCSKSRGIEVPLPARVLFVWKSENGVVIELKDGPMLNSRYVALSYTWGGNGQFSLTTQTEQSLRSGINTARLAKTIREAAELTHALGFNYLWIDALCIKQDSASDWEVQASQMAQIYGDSVLTLIAACSSSVEAGFLEPTTACAAYCGSAEYQGAHKPVFLTYGEGSSSMMAPEPLALRAWALQEEYLSKRKVKFTCGQMEWHCPSEVFKEQERSACNLPPSVQFANFARDSLSEWKNIVKDYAARQLTVQSDRLPGLSGLASLYAAQSGWDYLAGLWSGPHLLDLLLWFRTTKSPKSIITNKSSGYLAPSWSWVAVNAPVDYAYIETHRHISKVLSHSIRLKGSSTFGEVIDGHLDLSAPAIATTIAAITAVNNHRRGSISTQDASLLLEELFPEHIMEPVVASGMWPKFSLDSHDHSDNLAVHCLVLGHEWWSEWDYGMYGILVTPVSWEDRTFRRIGMFQSLPKFRKSNHKLNMKDLMTKRAEAAQQCHELYFLIYGKSRRILVNDHTRVKPKYGTAMRKEETEDQAAMEKVTGFEEEERDRAQTMTDDIVFHDFSIL